MKYILILFACSFTICIHSQEKKIQGKVIYANGKPAAYANVLLKNTKKGSITDSLGHFLIIDVPKGIYQLQVSMMGYKNKEVRINITNEKTVHVPIIVLTKDAKSLKRVVVKASYSMKLKRKDGKLNVNVANTYFEKSANAWQGLKKVPLLNISDQGGIKIFNKDAIVEINGVRTQMSGKQLQDYLESLNPGAIKNIEMQPNPGAAYGTEVNAVINIVLKRGRNNYRLSLNTTNGTRTKYFHKSGANYALNLKNFRLYTNYQFSYSPRNTTGQIAQQINNGPMRRFQYEEKQLTRKHSAMININFDIGEKDNIDLTQIFSLSNIGIHGLSKNKQYKRYIQKKLKSHQFQFAQVWKHEFNDSVSLELGSYQIIQKSENQNFAHTNGLTPENQFIKGDIPIFIGYIDYINDNKWGTTSAGLKYNNISVKNKNYSIIDLQKFPAPYHYSEEVLAVYLQHNIALSDTKSLRFGLRTETSFINYKFNAPMGPESFSDKLEYTNLLYNIEYNWRTEGRRHYNLSFKKQIQRPNYNFLNPYQAIESDIIYSAGDTSLDPAKFYFLSFYTYKGNWVFYGNTGILKDFISSVYQVKDQAITSTYRNFKNLYYVGFGFQYNKSFFKKIWTTKTGASLNFYKLKDDRFEIQETTPSIRLDTYNSIKLTENLRMNIDFEYTPTSKDGLLKHHSSSKLDISLTKEFGSNFTAILAATDIFKTDRSWLNTTIPGYFYETKLYNDIRSISLSLRWSITGKAYENRNIEGIDDAAIDRL